MAYSRLAYDPWNIPTEERKATFVGREILLGELLSAAREQSGCGTIQNYILLGPRGIGKTTVLLTLRDRVREDPELSKRWFSVQLREEVYSVRKLRDLLDLTLQALSEDEGVPEAEDVAKRARAERDDEKSLAIETDGLRSICASHGKRLLLFLDNFDQVFPHTPTGRGKKRPPQSEYRAFRKLLSTEGFLMVVGASMRLFEDIAAYDEAFFNFFCPVEIPSLSDDEIMEFLHKRAEADADQDFLRRYDKVRDHVRAITYMTGGNPRLVLMLYDVLGQREMLPVVQTLRETVGGLTPMLKHILDDMPRQQSKTLDALVRLGGVASPSSISERARLPLNVVTVQLGRLKDARFVTVEGEGKGRPAVYRVADPMFHTWYQMRYLRPAGRRIELFVEFLRAWFSVEDRRRFLEERWADLQKAPAGGRYSRAADACLGIEYYAASLDDEEERLGHFSRLADRLYESGRGLEAAQLLAESMASPGASPAIYESVGYHTLGDRLLVKGDLQKAIESHNEALRRNPKNAKARVHLGASLGLLGNHVAAVKELDVVIGMPKIPDDLMAIALNNRGVAKGRLGKHQGALRDFEDALRLNALTERDRCSSLLNRAAALTHLQRIPEAIGILTECAESRVTPETVYSAAARLIMLNLGQGHPDEAIRWASRLPELEPSDTTLGRRIEARIEIVTGAGRMFSLESAEALLEALQKHDEPTVAERHGFLEPAIRFAKDGDEKSLALLPREEQEIAKRIAATLKGEEGGKRDHMDNTTYHEDGALPR